MSKLHISNGSMHSNFIKTSILLIFSTNHNKETMLARTNNNTFTELIRILKHDIRPK